MADPMLLKLQDESCFLISLPILRRYPTSMLLDLFPHGAQLKFLDQYVVDDLLQNYVLNYNDYDSIETLSISYSDFEAFDSMKQLLFNKVSYDDKFKDLYIDIICQPQKFEYFGLIIQKHLTFDPYLERTFGFCLFRERIEFFHLGPDRRTLTEYIDDKSFDWGLKERKRQRELLDYLKKCMANKIWDIVSVEERVIEKCVFFAVGSTLMDPRLSLVWWDKLGTCWVRRRWTVEFQKC